MSSRFPAVLPISRAALVLAAAAGLVLWSPGPSSAQGGVDVQVSADGAPGGGVDIFAVINAGKRRVATTGADGEAEVPGETGIAVGTPVTVHVDRCGDRTEVLLVPDGETAPAPEAGCRRAPAGTVVWGQGGGIQVTSTASGATVGTGTAGGGAGGTGAAGGATGGGATGAAGGGAGTGAGGTAGSAGAAGSQGSGSALSYLDGELELGISLDLAAFHRWEDVGCEQTGITECSGGEWTPGLSLYGLWSPRWAPENAYLGLRFSYFAGQDLEQRYSASDPLLPRRTSIDVDGRSLDLFGGYRFRGDGLFPWPTEFGIFGGPSYMWNEAALAFFYGEDDFRESRTRTESGFKVNLGFDAAFMFRDELGIRAGYTHRTSFSDHDADVHHQFSIGGFRTLGPLRF